MKQNRLYELDIFSINHALTSFHMQSIPLFINVYPSTIVHPAFPDFLRKLKPIRSSRQHIVLEINEPEKISDIGLLKKRYVFLELAVFPSLLMTSAKWSFPYIP
jgi:EAL domain-containing protein (putative c-di-GMP-specific phosphodiesterase class I)